jgi:hypothetical protein
MAAVHDRPLCCRRKLISLNIGACRDFRGSGYGLSCQTARAPLYCAVQSASSGERHMTETSHQGSCLCGGIRYQLSSELRGTTHCHCSMCRKAHGAAFATHGGVPKSDLRLLAGAELLREYRSSPTIARSFCSQCGSQLFWQKSGEDWVAVSLGTLDTPFEPHKQRHIHVRSKAPWFAIHDKWPQSEKL